MKHLKVFVLFIGLALFTSCSESNVEEKITKDNNLAIFSGVVGAVETRVSGTNWDENDAIGVYALIANQTTVFDAKSNVAYVTGGDGKFTSVVTAEAVKFPLQGNLDFVAYHPYNDKLNSLEYAITDGSDPLFSNNAKQQNNANPRIDLGFKHMLARVVLNIEVGDYLTSLEGLKASVNNVSVDGKFNLATGKVTLGKEKSVDVDISFDNSAEGVSRATFSMLVMPSQNIQDIEVLFTLGEDTYKWYASSSLTLSSSLEYLYNVKLNAKPEPYVAEIGTAKIYGWGEGHSSTDFDFLDPEAGDNPLGFTTDIDKIQFNASSQLSRIVKLSAATSQSWTITKNVDWLTLNPEAGGTGGKDITISASKNTNRTERTAIVAIIPTNNNSLEPIVVSVTQSGSSVTEKNDGTKERPFTVAEAIANQGVKDNKDYVWVKAYIVGTETSGLSLDGAVATNILIADNKEESDINKAMPAQLPDNDVRRSLNLKYNPSMYKAKVLLNGTLEEYFKGPGMKNIKEFELISTN